MRRQTPSEHQRWITSALFGRKHGEPTERPATNPRGESDETATRRRLEDLDEARRLKRETDWLAE